MGRTEAFGAIHAPQSFPSPERARRRLAFDELFRLQLEVVMRRHVQVNARALHHDVSPPETPAASATLVARFLAGLPYELTKAQRRAVEEIVADLAGPARCTASSRGMSARARGSSPGRVVGGGPRRSPGRPHGADRSLGGTAFLGVRASSPPSRTPATGGGRCAWELLTNRAERPRPHRGAPRDGDGRRSTSWSGTHALLTEEVRVRERSASS